MYKIYVAPAYCINIQYAYQKEIFFYKWNPFYLYLTVKNFNELKILFRKLPKYNIVDSFQSGDIFTRTVTNSTTFDICSDFWDLHLVKSLAEVKIPFSYRFLITDENNKIKHFSLSELIKKKESYPHSRRGKYHSYSSKSYDRSYYYNFYYKSYSKLNTPQEDIDIAKEYNIYLKPHRSDHHKRQSTRRSSNWKEQSKNKHQYKIKEAI